jgi:hypothetical protein
MAPKNPPSGEGRIAAEMADLARRQTSAPAIQPTPGSGGFGISGDVGEGFDREVERAEIEGYDVFSGDARTPRETVNTNTNTTPAGPTEAEIQRGIDRRNILNTLRGVMADYGLSSLMGRIEQLVQEDYSPEAALVAIRETPEYKTRFPAMDALARKNRRITEAEYIAFERDAAQLERAYGLPAGMLGKDSVTNLLTNEVSARELEERVTMAAAGAFQASQEVKDTFKEYYSIDSGGLTAYFLDPNKALPLLNKQYASAQIGAEAAIKGLGIGSTLAEEINMMGISREQARQGFGQAASQKAFTEGRGDIVTQEELVTGNVMGNEQAQQNIQRAAGARAGRFQGGGDFLSTNQGAVGLGTAATR